MKVAMTVAVTMLLLGAAYANCPNQCSGNGLCQTSTDNCQCYRGYIGNDCGLRTCPVERAWVDAARGDQNADGVVGLAPSSTSFTTNAFGSGIVRDFNGFTQTAWERLPHDQFGTRINSASGVAKNEGHFYAECSGAGVCDRSTGLCQCFEGYTGRACTRMVCPNSCSGHGTCEFIHEFSAGSSYNLWDKSKSRLCSCDAGWGSSDCSQRLCPRGDDPLTTNVTSTEVQNVRIKCNTADIEGSFRLEFTDYFGEKWATKNISLAGTDLTTPANLETNVQVALQSLPHGRIPSVTVSVTETTDDEDYTIAVSFTGNPGDNYLLGFDKRGTLCGGSSGNVIGTHGSDIFSTYKTTWGGKSNTECSNRGLCDYETGQCKCFQGYIGYSCSQQDAMAV